MSTAICCMSMQPEHFEFWIFHHLEIVGFDYILLRIENTILEIPEPYKSRVFICESVSIQDGHIDSIPRQQERQMNFVNGCLQEICFLYNIQYLLHIDDDELIVLRNDFKRISQLLSKYVPFTNLRFQNYEAVLRGTPRNTKYFFQTTWFKNGSLEECRSYRNGKSLTNVKKQTRSNGSHTFTGEWIKVSEEDAIILHYDSISFEKWKKKFLHLKTMTKIPKSIFPFYQDSINLFLNNPQENVFYEFWQKEITKCKNPINVCENYNLVLIN